MRDNFMRKLVLRTALAALAGWVGSACDFALPQQEWLPTAVRTGEHGALPAVLDLRRDSLCTADGTEGIERFTLRFSKPMNRENVEASIGIAEITGDTFAGAISLSQSLVGASRDSIRWEDNDRLIAFSAVLQPARQYVLVLPETVTDRTGKGLDGLVGADVNGDGSAVIRMDEGQYARVDDDYLRTPAGFHSLPFIRCGDAKAGSIFHAPLNYSRPRLLSFIGLLPNSEQVPAYRIDRGVFPFTITDGAYYLREPLPPEGALRIEIASRNASPARDFSQQISPAGILPSTLVGALDIEDENGASYQPGLFLDERLRVAAPVMGTIESASGRVIVSPALSSVPDDVLAGMQVVLRAPDGYQRVYEIEANSAAARSLTVQARVYEDADTGLINLNTLIFRNAAFREDELIGLKIESERVGDAQLTVVGNRAKEVSVEGQINCARAQDCLYWIHTNLGVLNLANQTFEVVPRYLFLKTGRARLLEQTYVLRLNIGAQPMTDAHGVAFVDGYADGSEQRAAAEDEWRGRFPTGDFRLRSIPPTLQLNDGRWYSPFENGPLQGAEIEFGAYGKYTYLAEGIYGKFVRVCEGFGSGGILGDLAMTFVTPNGAVQAIGKDDLLPATALTSDLFGAFRIENAAPVPIGIRVSGVTVPFEAYRSGQSLGTQSTTVVRLAAPREKREVTFAGLDGICGTEDDLRDLAFRPWRTGDRLLISHRLSYAHGDKNTLDGNHDGILSSAPEDDIILEYRPNTESLFQRITPRW
jgi:hypothetical protein